MDKPSLSFSPPALRAGPSSTRAVAGFSLVEVAMAIGIVAFAFVALFSLIPTGLTTFRSSIDTGNETWIMENMNSMIQTTDFSKVPDLAFKAENTIKTTSDYKEGQIYYYDEEGKPTDTELKPS